MTQMVNKLIQAGSAIAMGGFMVDQVIYTGGYALCGNHNPSLSLLTPAPSFLLPLPPSPPHLIVILFPFYAGGWLQQTC